MPAQLEFKNLAGKELQGKAIMYNWVGLGWWAGQILSVQVLTNPSFGRSMASACQQISLSNIWMVVGSEGEHALTLGKYGKGALCEGERWVLLERAVENIEE